MKSAPTSEETIVLPARSRWAIGLSCLALLLPLLLLRATLIDPLPRWATAIAAVSGGAAGFYLLILMDPWLKAQRDWRTYCAIVITPVMSAMLATFYLRAAVEMVAFTAAETRIDTVEAEVTDLEPRRSVSARAAPDARTLRIAVNADLWAQLDPRGAPGRDCLKLTVETGRWGIRRTRLPAAFDHGFGIDRLVPCAAQRDAEA